MSLTIGETAAQLHSALRDYIEATYHVSHPQLIGQRREALNRPGVIHQRPYLESTPRYQSGGHFAGLSIPAAAKAMFERLAKDGLIFDPPYMHQAAAIEGSLGRGKSLLVMTGTGSGKTECFLLPIMGKLAIEGASGGSFKKHSAVRSLVLYPMNALVNDQLGRLRMLFGDKRVVTRFKEQAGRPARFARYTSRTLYPGVRNEKKDADRLGKAIGSYYVKLLKTASDPSAPDRTAAAKLINELRKRGKWPAKADLRGWYGEDKTRWKDAAGAFKRCVTQPEDAELLTRHEVQESPPDILVTNYSMLEYMLMRPLERPIFDATKTWLRDNPSEKFLLVVDEAHLYRGAAGAEVALLIRRLRARLDIPAERLQVICTSASFNSPEAARRFAAQLTGKEEADFEAVQGTLVKYEPDKKGTNPDVEALAAVDLDRFYDAASDIEKLELVRGFLTYRRHAGSVLGPALYEALVSYGPMAKLINITMRQAMPLEELADKVFDASDHRLKERALTALVALGSAARKEPHTPGLLPCRVHSFHRGLPGLWVCIDPNCTSLPKSQRSGPCGALYSQPRDSCDCGGRVFELFTCRSCGTAYIRAYTNDVANPDFLWHEPGNEVRTAGHKYEELKPIDLLLEQPAPGAAVPAELDIVTGRLDPPKLGERSRVVYKKLVTAPEQDDDEEGAPAPLSPGEFVPCGVCGQSAKFGRSSVQDHQTKGDQPVQALISRQIEVQPPGADWAKHAPLRGRKVLIFSDSRQTAARLAPNLQTYSMRDVMRPLIACGMGRLQKTVIKDDLSLEDLYLAVMVAAAELKVRLRPELRAGEQFHADVVEDRIAGGALNNDLATYKFLVESKSFACPASLLKAILSCIDDRYYGLESLALASVVETGNKRALITAANLPNIPGVVDSEDQRIALVRAWFACWRGPGYWLSKMPADWWNQEVKGHLGKFKELAKRLETPQNKKVFTQQWLPFLLQNFTEQQGPKFRILGNGLSLAFDGSWAYCETCKTTQRPFPGTSKCIRCGRPNVRVVDPDSDQVFAARKGYYRASTVKALRSGSSPMSLIAAEHTAQLNAAQVEQVFSKAEEHELLFQDVDLGVDEDGRERAAVDVLSCTTTMEVGIDIGALTGVSLRNMPPGRANYQQRAGRAGRRGNAVATVTAFGSADSHDEHYFSQPAEMISGKVIDPALTLDNIDITKRHVLAYLLQRYHQEKLPNIAPEAQPQLFAVLGTVAAFKRKDSILNRDDFEKWIRREEASLKQALKGWLPKELGGGISAIVDPMCEDATSAIDAAIAFDDKRDKAESRRGSEEEMGEVADETDDETSVHGPESDNLLDRLLYKGVLPRYAFPTDVATFHIFDPNQSSRFRPIFRFTPSQGLPVALSQYAPGKQVWVCNQLWRSGAIYAPVSDDRSAAWARKKLYFECQHCGFAKTFDAAEGTKNEKRDCEACGSQDEFGPAQYWLRPPGFAHPVTVPSGTSPDDAPAKSYATRAKLTADTPALPEWTRVNERVSFHSMRRHLLVTNRGPRNDGYVYCTLCGLIEPAASINGSTLVTSSHPKPFPDEHDQNCPGNMASSGLVLGTDFITDILLVSLKVESPISVRPGLLATNVALRTIAEAMTKAACQLLSLEQGELQGEFRPALTELGRNGQEAEIYIYDTLAGGAGFARQVGQLGEPLLAAALKVLEDCPDNCDRSCYRCLRSYKNKFEHELLDRHLGAALLGYMISGKAPTLQAGRIESSTESLFQDLVRQNISGLELRRNHVVKCAGLGAVTAPIYARRKDGSEFIISVHNPLTPDTPEDPMVGEAKEFATSVSVKLVDELVIRRSLPNATNEVLDLVGGDR